MIEKISPPITTIKHVATNSDQYIPENFQQVAAGMESQFIDLMIQQMRKSVPLEEAQSSAEEIFSAMEDSERAKILSTTKKGIGLKDLVLDEIYPKKFRNRLAYDSYMKQQEAFNQQTIKANSAMRENRDNIVIHEKKDVTNE